MDMRRWLILILAGVVFVVIVTLASVKLGADIGHRVGMREGYELSFADMRKWTEGSVVRPEPSNLVSASSPYVYFVHKGRRSVFPTTDILESWYGMTPPPEVIRVSDDVVARFQITGNVFIREGTFVVRSLSSPQLYWVGQMGVLHAIPEETVRQWSMLMPLETRIRVLPDYLLTGYQISDVPVGLLPDRVVDGMLFSQELITRITPEGWNTTLYLVDHGEARVVTTAGFVANGLLDRFCLYRPDLTVGSEGVLRRGPDLVDNDYWARFNPGTHP